MPKIELDEEEYNRLLKTQGTLAKIAENPKARVLVEQAHKLVDPTAKTPTLDANAPMETALEAVNKTISDFTKKQEDREAAEKADRELTALKNRQDDGWNRLRGDRSWTAEGLKKVEAYMSEKGILDPEDAAALVLRDNPPPPPAMPGGTGAWNFLGDVSNDGDNDIKKLIEKRGEDEGLLHKMSQAALSEVRGVNGARR